MKFKIYDVVRLVAINNQQMLESDTFNLSPPKVGDVATILEIYDDPPGYELECCDEYGITVWLLGFREGDIRLESV